MEDYLVRINNHLEFYNKHIQEFNTFKFDLQIAMRYGQDLANTDWGESRFNTGEGLSNWWINGVKLTADKILSFYNKNDIDETTLCYWWNKDPETENIIFKKRVLQTKDIISEILEAWWIKIKEKFVWELMYWHGKDEFDRTKSNDVNNLLAQLIAYYSGYWIKRSTGSFLAMENYPESIDFSTPYLLTGHELEIS